ncbi:ParA family protein [Pseudomonas sp. 1 R 17]|uniref:ParA family protein n=1 Tax=Pseudomonas sp. 1 R 17 TaxID=1844091 RepID=UPI000811D55E|nr:AAA family ATPase [Pseudomonas sp. 1 R 17]SAM36038.1 CobQ/CobB/MinD/ParA nucleotide binding domain protein [Pseudomonas sp. 1 R 17]
MKKAITLDQIEKKKTKTIVAASHKSSGKTTFLLNLADYLLQLGFSILYVDLDPIRAADDFYVQRQEMKDKAIQTLTDLITINTDNENFKNIPHLNQKIKNLTMSAKLKVYGSAIASFNIDNVQNTHTEFDFILVDIPANIYTSTDEIKPQFLEILKKSDLAIFPFKADAQELKTAPYIGRVVKELKAGMESKGKSLDTIIRSLISFESSKYKGAKGISRIEETLTDFHFAYGETHPPILAPMVYRAIYPNMLAQAKSIFSSNSAESDIAKAEFKAIADQIFAELNINN